MEDDLDKETQLRNMKLFLETASKIFNKGVESLNLFFKALILMFFLLYLAVGGRNNGNLDMETTTNCNSKISSEEDE